MIPMNFYVFFGLKAQAGWKVWGTYCLGFMIDSYGASMLLTEGHVFAFCEL